MINFRQNIVQKRKAVAQFFLGLTQDLQWMDLQRMSMKSVL